MKKDEVSVTLSRALAEAFSRDVDGDDGSRVAPATASMKIELVGVSVNQVRRITLDFAGGSGDE